jgi:hypothetical protein
VNRLRTLVVVLGVVIVGLMALLVVLLVARGPGAPLIAPAAPGQGLSQRTILGLVGILSGCGCLVLIGAGAAVVLMWNRRGGAVPPGPDTGASTPTAPGTAATGLTLVQGKANTAHLVLAGSGLLIGRGGECTLVMDDPGVSLVHARLDPHAGGWLLTDMRSGTGTYVNGRRILQHQLQPGDQIRVGQTVIEVE